MTTSTRLDTPICDDIGTHGDIRARRSWNILMNAFELIE